MSPCLDATVEHIISLKPDNTVREAMNIFAEKDIRSLPVVDNDGKYLGLVGLRHILKKLLPASVTMEDGLENLDFIQDATPGIAKRLKRLYPMPVTEVMDAEYITIEPDTATWEAVRVMALHGSPVPIVNEKTNKLDGLITRQSLLTELDRNIDLIDEDDAE